MPLQTRLRDTNTIAIIAWLLAILFFLMYAFGWEIGSFDQREELGVGLALFVTGALIP
jgi:hypothetical protein